MSNVKGTQGRGRERLAQDEHKQPCGRHGARNTAQRTADNFGVWFTQSQNTLYTRAWMTSNKQTVTKRKNADDFKTHRISKIVHVNVLFVVCFLASHRVVSFGAHKQSSVVEFKRGRCEGHRRHKRSRTVFFCVAMFSEINKAVSSSTKPPLISNKTPETNVHQKHCPPLYRC